MKCDELKVYKVYTTRNEGAFGFCEGSDPTDIELEHESVCLKSDVDKVTAQLKEKLHDVDNQWNEQCKEIARLKAENESLKAKLENVQASAYADNVDAGMRERRLNRALWIARAELCRRLDIDRYLRNHRNSWYNENFLTWYDSCVAMDVKMCKAKSKCQAKAEEYR